MQGMSRGSSILAGLVLIGTLSALAVVLDNSAAVRVARIDPASQNAAALRFNFMGKDYNVSFNPAEKTGSFNLDGQKGTFSIDGTGGTVKIGDKTVKAAVDDTDQRKCEPNFNYKVLVDPTTKDTKVICVVPTGDAALTHRCPGDLKGCSNEKDDDVVIYNAKSDYTKCTKFPCDGMAQQEWKDYCERGSQLKLCVPQDMKAEVAKKKGAPDDKSCVYSSCSPKDDKGVLSKAKHGAATNLPSLLKNANDKETLEALKSTQGLLKADKASTDILSKAFDDAGKGTARDLAATDAAIAAQKKAIDDLRNMGDCQMGDCSASIAAEQEKLKRLEEDRARLLEQQKRLALAQEDLKPKTDPGTKEKGGPYAQSGYGPGGGDPRNPFGGKDGNTFPKLPMMPMQPGKGGSKGNNDGRNPQQCYNYQQYSAQNNAYCSNGAIYAYNSQTCQYQVQLQCPSGQCNTQNLTNDMYGRQISTQCAPTTPTNTQITAQLSCNPRRVDLGSPTTITYSCSQGTATGNGFTATGTSGSATVTPEKPPRGSTSVTYGLTCTGAQGQTVQATPCQVEVNVPLIVIVASPQEVESGKYTTLGWVTRGMKSCTVQSLGNHGPWNTEQAKNTSVSGTVKSPDLTQETIFELSCKTQDDKDKKATATVRIK